MSQLRRAHLNFRELNAEVLVVAAIGLHSLAKFTQELALPFPALSDANEKVYRAYGLGKGLAIHRRTPMELARLVWREKRLHRPVGDVIQVGGDFIVDGKGVIRFAHSSEDPTDRPEVAGLLQRIGELKLALG